MKTCIGYDTPEGHVDCGGPLMTMAGFASRRVKRCPRCAIKQEKFQVAAYTAKHAARKETSCRR